MQSFMTPTETIIPPPKNNFTHKILKTQDIYFPVVLVSAQTTSCTPYCCLGHMGGTPRFQVFHSKHFALNSGNNALTYVRYIKIQKIKEMHDRITLHTGFFSPT